MTFASILSHARATPDKTAIAISGNATSYRLYAKLIAAAREWTAAALPAGEGVFAACTRDPLADWVLIHALRSLGRTAVAVPDMETLARLGLPGLAAVIVLSAERSGPAPDGVDLAVLPAAVLLEAGARPLPDDPGEQPLGDFIEYTSGSTGANKAVVRRGDQVDQMVARAGRDYRLDGDTVFHFIDLPPWASVGSKCPTTLWAHGGTCVYDFRKDRLDHLFEFPINHLYAPPRLLRSLADRAYPAAMPGLEVFTGGGFVSWDDVRDLRARLGCTVFLSYAGTETGVRLQTRVTGEEDVLWLPEAAEDGLEIIDADGRPVGDDVEGEVRVRLEPADPREYLANPLASAEMFRDGWFHPGDLAVRRTDGRVRILGRTADVLNIGGIKRAAAPFEARARELLGGRPACLFVRQDDRGVEVLHVAVESPEPLEPRHVDAFRRAFAVNFPRVAVHPVAAFPVKGGLQKVDRARLVAMITSRQPATG